MKYGDKPSTGGPKPTEYFDHANDLGKRANSEPDEEKLSPVYDTILAPSSGVKRDRNARINQYDNYSSTIHIHSFDNKKPDTNRVYKYADPTKH